MDRTTELIAALSAHPAETEEERGFRDETLALLRAGGDPFDRGRFRPGHVTASGFVLSPDRDRLLLLHHAKLGRWLQPGGHVEAGDRSVREASRREVLEETGVAVRPAGGAVFDVDVHEIPPRGAAPRHRHFDVRYLWFADSETISTSDEARAVAWVPWTDLERRFESPSLRRVHSKLASGMKTRLE